MTVILGIDAAWTDNAPSGVAVVSGSRKDWVCHAVAPSHSVFLAMAQGRDVEWSDPIDGKVSTAAALLDAAARLSGGEVDIVAIDMPISTIPFSTRRAAERAVSREFGKRLCSAHTPNATRPGKTGSDTSAGFMSCGYPIATTVSMPNAARQLIEVYPHPALLSLLGRPTRVRYKVAKSSRYWPGKSVQERIVLLLEEFTEINIALRRVFGPSVLTLPVAESVSRLTNLKRYEDALDALVCCWVGMLHVAGQTIPLGDEIAAIWCPKDVVSQM